MARFGFLIFNKCEELDLVGPWEMITNWTKMGGPECMFIAKEPEPVKCAKGMMIAPHTTITQCSVLDYLLIPGGWGTRDAAEDPEIIQFIKTQAVDCKAILSVCTGTYLLYAAELIDGKKVTTHWGAMNTFKQYPEVTLVEDRIVHDDKIWTASGVAAGIDLALELIYHEAGIETASKVQFNTEYYPIGMVYGEEYKNSNAPTYLKDMVEERR